MSMWNLVQFDWIKGLLGLGQPKKKQPMDRVWVTQVVKVAEKVITLRPHTKAAQGSLTSRLWTKSSEPANNEQHHHTM